MKKKVSLLTLVLALCAGAYATLPGMLRDEYKFAPASATIEGAKIHTEKITIKSTPKKAPAKDVTLDYIDPTSLAVSFYESGFDESELMRSCVCSFTEIEGGGYECSEFMGQSLFQPIMTWDEDGNYAYALGQVLYETSDYQWVMAVIEDDDVLTSGYASFYNTGDGVIRCDEIFGIYVISTGTGEGAGWYDVAYGYSYAVPNGVVSYIDRNDRAIEVPIYYTVESNNMIVTTSFSPDKMGYFVYIVCCDDSTAIVANDYPAIWSQQISDGTKTGDFYIYSIIENDIDTLTATIYDDQQTIVFDSDWTLLSPESDYWYGQLSAATIYLNKSKPSPEQKLEYVITGSFNGWNPSDKTFRMTSDDGVIFSAKNVSIRANEEFKITLADSWEKNFGYNETYVPLNQVITLIQDGNNMMFANDFIDGTVTINVETGEALFISNFEMPTENVAVSREQSDCPVADQWYNANCILKLDDNTWIGINSYDQNHPVVYVYTDQETITIPDAFYYIDEYMAELQGIYAFGDYGYLNVEWAPNLKSIHFGKNINSNMMSFDGSNVTDIYVNCNMFSNYSYTNGERTVCFHVPIDCNVNNYDYNFEIVRGDEERGLPTMSYSNYRVRLDDGTVLGLWINNNGDLSVVQIYSESQGVIIPEELPYGTNDNMMPVKQIGRSSSYSHYSALFEQAANVTSLTIPAQVNALYINWSYTNLKALHMACEYPYVNWTPSGLTVYVQNQAYYGNYAYKWSNCSVLPEGWDFEWVEINVARAGEFAQKYLEVSDNDWGYAYRLRVTGNLSDQDVANIANLTMLMDVDLSGAKFTTIPSYWMSGKTILRTVVLPNSVTTISSYAFQNCSALSSVTVDGDNHISTVQERAFYGCSSLETFDLSNVRTIGASAFYNCSSYAIFTAPSATSIGNYAFYKTAIASIDESFFSENIAAIPSYAFDYCTSLESVILPDQILTINSYAFANCPCLSEIKLPANLTSIGSDAFYGSAITTVTLPSTLASIGSSAFGSCYNLESVKCRAIMPPTASGNFTYGVDLSGVVLYVPSFSIDSYRIANYWNYFYIMEGLTDPIDRLYIDRAFAITVYAEDEATFADGPEVALANPSSSVGQLTIDGEGAMPISTLTTNPYLGRRDYGRTSNYRRPSLIVNNPNVTVDNAVAYISVASSYWHFFSLPFDVKVSDIVAPADTYWVIRKYDAYQRALGNSGSTWVNLTDDDTLEAGQGYILNAYYANGVASFAFPSAAGADCSMLVASGDVTVALKEIDAEFNHNRSWNLVGNPYPAYYNMHGVVDQNGEEFTTPYTLWRGSSYTAYSTLDDEVILQPFEAFFIQKPEDAEMIFGAESRMHYQDAYDASSSSNRGMFAPARKSSRSVFNFTVADGEMTNRCRVVMNEEAKIGYEVGRDALKFFTVENDCPLIYVSDDQDYEICERPFDTGEATLGFDAAASGIYTLSLSGRYDSDWTVILTDNLTGESIDLTEEGEYVFSAEEGSNQSRFSIAFYAPNTLGIDSIYGDLSADTDAAIYNLGGMKVFEGRIGDFSARKTGVYMINANGNSQKVMIK